MNAKMFLADFGQTFVVAFIVAVVVTFVWNLIVHSTGGVDWETSFRLAIILGIVLPITKGFRSRAEVKG
jgi:hypothetical protein